MLRKIMKIAMYFIGIIVLLLIVAIGFVKLALPNAGPAPHIKIVATPERVAHGEYLALHVCGCMACHSRRDESKFTPPVVEETYGQGGEVFPTEAGIVIAPDISPFALEKWTDGEIYRAVAYGVNKSGKPLFRLMPYKNFGQMDAEDIYSIIAFIRTLKPVTNRPQRSQLNFPMNIIVHTIPSKKLKIKGRQNQIVPHTASI